MRLFTSLVATVVTSWAGLVFAQSAPSRDFHTFRPSVDPSAGISYEPASTPDRGEWNAGAWISFDHHPIDVRRSDGSVESRPVREALYLDLVGNVGLGKRVALGVSAPMVLYQFGSEGLGGALVGGGGPIPTAIGDVGLHTKVAIVDDREGGVGLALLGEAFLPTGHPRSFLGDESLRVGARFLGEWNLKLAALEASVGARVRTHERRWPADVELRSGAELPWSISAVLLPGVFIPAARDRHRWELSVRGSLPLGPDVYPFGSGAAALSPTLASFAERMVVGQAKEISLLLGVDVGLNTAIGVPLVRGIFSVGFVPRTHDMDGDGIADDLDECPQIPEDKDGIEDQDGCPDVDDDDEPPASAGPKKSTPSGSG